MAMLINSTTWRGARSTTSHPAKSIILRELRAQPPQVAVASMYSTSFSIQITSQLKVSSKQQINHGRNPAHHRHVRCHRYHVASASSGSSGDTRQQNSIHQTSPEEQSQQSHNSGNGIDGGDGGESHRKQTSSDDRGEPWRRYPPWLKVWMWVIALAYLVARTRWRADREAKKRELEKETAAQEAQNQAWDRFVEDYRKSSCSKQSLSRRSSSS